MNRQVLHSLARCQYCATLKDAGKLPKQGAGIKSNEFWAQYMNQTLIDPLTGEQMELDSTSSDTADQQTADTAGDATAAHGQNTDNPEDMAAEENAATSRAHLQQRQAEWANLPYDSTRLLRLAPLTAERETGLRPLLFASFGRVARHSKEVSMLRLVVTLPDQKAAKGSNLLELWVDHLNKEIHVLPEHGLATEPGNRGLGRLFLAQAAAWCKPKWYSYALPMLELKTKLVNNDLARLRRDHALQAQGLTVTYTDGVQMSAQCAATSLEQLGKEWNREKIRIMDTLEVAQLLHSSDQNLRAQTTQISTLNERLDLLKREDNTQRFTIITLVFFSVFQAALLIWMATR